MGLFCIGSLHAFLPQLCLCFHVLCLRCRKTEHCKHPMWLSSVPRTFVKPEDAILYSLCTVDLLGSIGYNNLRYGHMSAPQHIVLQGTLEHRHFFKRCAATMCSWRPSAHSSLGSPLWKLLLLERVALPWSSLMLRAFQDFFFVSLPCLRSCFYAYCDCLFYGCVDKVLR